MELKFFSVDEIAEHPDFPKVVEAYTSESGNPDLGKGAPAIEHYKMLESAGMLHVEGAVDGDRLVGLIVLVVSLYPHFGVKVGSVDAIYLDKDYRQGAAGLKLIRRIEHVAKEMGAVGVYFGARRDSRLAKLYDRLFTPMNALWWVKL